MNLPKISVVTVSFNQGEFIRQNIESVLAQNYPNFEHIIVDGGSTDSTIDILKSYPHLQWTSGPDRRQSDALNKGFAAASGEIIAWLNSDDWYAPAIFQDVAAALQDYPVVIGAAEQTNKDGKTTEIVRNIGRTYFDLWRYWIPYAWLAQPSVFFRKSLLDEVKRPDGTYIDEDLYFTMDYDLWMRMAVRYPFTNYIDKTLSYFRIYDQNKTGARPLATQRECSRVFKRYANQGHPQEQEISFIIPTSSPTEGLKATAISLTKQHALNFELVLVDCSKTKDESKALHNFALDLSEAIDIFNVRYIKSSTPSELSALHTGAEHSTSPVISFLQAGDAPDPNYSLLISRAFARDVTGLVLSNTGNETLLNLYAPKNGELNLAAPFIMPSHFPHFSIRRNAYLEFSTLADTAYPQIALRKLLLQIIFRGWSLYLDTNMNLIPSLPSRPKTNDPFMDMATQHLVVAHLLYELAREQALDPFKSVRKKIRNFEVLYAMLNEDPASILKKADPNWMAVLKQE